MAHNFQPIDSEEKFEQALEYVAKNSVMLAKAVLDRELWIDTLCFFAQSDAEYAFLVGAIKSRGQVSHFSHEPTLYVDTSLSVAEHDITILGVRRPDPLRIEVGYADYPVDDYAGLLQEIKSNPNAQEVFGGTGKSLIELRHPDFDVRGYAVAEANHK